MCVRAGGMVGVSSLLVDVGSMYNSLGLSVGRGYSVYQFVPRFLFFIINSVRIPTRI